MAKKFSFAVVIEGVDRVTAPLRRVNQRLRGMTKPLRELQQKFSLLSKESGLTRLAGNVKRVGSGIMSVGREAVAMGKRLALAATIAGGALFGLTNAFASAGDNAAKTAQRLGVNVEWLQEMRFAATRSGIATQSFDMSIQRFGRRLGEAIAFGRGEALPALKALGIQLKDNAGHARSVEEILPEVADKLRRVKDETVRNAIAMKFFDSEGVAMVQLLEEGSAGMEKLRERARELGVVIGEDDAKAAEVFSDSMDDLRAALTGLRNIVGSALMPVLNDLISQFIVLAVKYGPQLRVWAQEFAKQLPGRLAEIWELFKGLLAVLKPLAQVALAIAGFFDSQQKVFAALALIIGAKLIGAIIGLTSALGAMGVTIALTPIGWFIGILAALIAITVLIIARWDHLAAWWSNLWGNTLAEPLQGFMDMLNGDIWGGFKRFIGGMASLALRLPVIVIGAVNDLVAALTGFNIADTLTGMLPDWAKRGLGIGVQATGADAGAQRAAVARSDAAQQLSGAVAVDVNFANMPRGTQANATTSGGLPFSLNQGFSMVAP